MRKCTCPNCNAALEFSEDREFGFCEFCGTKIMLDDVRILSRHEDVAEVKKVELELEKLHMEREEREEKRARFNEMKKTRNKLILLAIALWVAALIILLIVWGIASLFGGGDSIKVILENVLMFGVLILFCIGIELWDEYSDAHKDATDKK